VEAAVAAHIELILPLEHLILVEAEEEAEEVNPLRWQKHLLREAALVLLSYDIWEISGL
jgi:hypothetical protein